MCWTTVHELVIALLPDMGCLLCPLGSLALCGKFLCEVLSYMWTVSGWNPNLVRLLKRCRARAHPHSCLVVWNDKHQKNSNTNPPFWMLSNQKEYDLASRVETGPTNATLHKPRCLHPHSYVHLTLLHYVRTKIIPVTHPINNESLHGCWCNTYICPILC